MRPDPKPRSPNRAVTVRLGRRRTGWLSLPLLALGLGCSIAPKTFQGLSNPAAIVRARAVGLGNAAPRRAGDSAPDRTPERRRRGRPPLGARGAPPADRPGLRLRPLGRRLRACTRRAALARLVGGPESYSGQIGKNSLKYPAPIVGIPPRAPVPTDPKRLGREDRPVTEDPRLVSATLARPCFAPALALQAPLARIGRWTLAGVAELGQMATLLGQAARSLVRPPEAAPPFRPALVQQLATLLAMGLPLVALVHVGMGSFLSLQAYYGGTFVDGTGAVVGVGLIRNVAPMMAGLTMAGLIAVRTTSELRGRPLGRARSTTRSGSPIATPRPSVPVEPLYTPDPARLAAVRIAAAVIVGPIMALWGALVGTVVGWQVAQTMLGVSTHGFFSMMWEMLWLRDVTGLVIKGGHLRLAGGPVRLPRGTPRHGHVPGSSRRRRLGRLPRRRAWPRSRSWSSTAAGSCSSTTPGPPSARPCSPPRGPERHESEL